MTNDEHWTLEDGRVSRGGGGLEAEDQRSAFQNYSIEESLNLIRQRIICVHVCTSLRTSQ